MGKKISITIACGAVFECVARRTATNTLGFVNRAGWHELPQICRSLGAANANYLHSDVHALSLVGRIGVITCRSGHTHSWTCKINWVLVLIKDHIVACVCVCMCVYM